ncbi:MAG TPA: hypothetical protein VK791_06345 [bacterium]|jgi:hypothetical protein|nr:hypothetical protein [bacterium]
MQILEKEIQTYQKELPNLLSEQGKYVLIHNQDINGPYVAYEDALNIGYEKYKLEPFLIKKIEENETVFFLSRDLQV